MEKRYKYKMFHLATLFKYKMFYLVMTSSAVWKKKVSKKKKTYMVWEGQGGVVERAHGVGGKENALARSRASRAFTFISWKLFSFANFNSSGKHYSNKSG